MRGRLMTWGCVLRGCASLLGCRLIAPRGAVAQLGERRVRNAKVGSSILLGSTNWLESIS